MLFRTIRVRWATIHSDNFCISKHLKYSGNKNILLVFSIEPKVRNVFLPFFYPHNLDTLDSKIDYLYSSRWNNNQEMPIGCIPKTLGGKQIKCCTKGCACNEHRIWGFVDKSHHIPYHRFSKIVSHYFNCFFLQF